MTEEKAPRDAKDEQLEGVRERNTNTLLTTAQGVRVDDTENSVTIGDRGPTLMEDFHAREKITISTISASPNVWSTPAVPARMAASSHMTAGWPNTPPPST